MNALKFQHVLLILTSIVVAVAPTILPLIPASLLANAAHYGGPLASCIVTIVALFTDKPQASPAGKVASALLRSALPAATPQTAPPTPPVAVALAPIVPPPAPPAALEAGK